MTKHFLSLFIALLLLHSNKSHGQIVISTYAGTESTGGYYGDDGPAISAQLSSPSDVAVDKIGNLYIADFVNNVIRKVDTFGIISNFAGTGFGASSSTIPSGAYTGDGGPATAADLNGPFALAIDKFGNVIFADGYNHVVRKVSTTGIITTIAGKNSAGYSGDGGPGTAAELNNPVGIAVDTNGIVYIADDHNNVIRKLALDGTISTYAGDSTAGYAGSGGTATSALLNLPLGVAVDKAGNLFIADAMNNMVRKVDKTTGILTDYIGTADTAHGFSGDEGPAVNAKLYYPTHLAFDKDDNLYVADAYNNRVRMVTPSGIISTFAGTGTRAFGGDNGPATSADLYYPHGVAITQSGIVYIADRGNQVIRRVGPQLPNGAGNIPNISNKGLNVYPNPVNKGIMTVNINAPITEPTSLTITNILGQVITKATISSNMPSTVALNAPAGIYVVTAANAHGNWRMEIVVQ